MNTSETYKTISPNENQSAKSQELYQTLRKEVKLHRAESALMKLLFLPISSLVFFVIGASYGSYFVVEFWETWYFAFSGSVVAAFSILYVLLSIRQLSQILSIDYTLPVSKIQQSTAQTKSSVVDNLRLAAWLFPFAPFIGVFMAKVLFNFDLTTIVSMDFIATFGVITILLEIISLVMLKALRPRNIDAKWMKWLLAGSSSQIDESLDHLDQIKEYDIEEMKA